MALFLIDLVKKSVVANGLSVRKVRRLHEITQHWWRQKARISGNPQPRLIGWKGQERSSAARLLRCKFAENTLQEIPIVPAPRSGSIEFLELAGCS
jgi:hypothetical protein